MGDRLMVTDLRFWARHGALAEERERRQRFSVDVSVYLDLRPAGSQDRLDQSIDYRFIWAVVHDVMVGPPRQLLEALAEEIAARLLVPPVSSVVVCVKKLDPPLPDIGGFLAAEVTRHA